MGAVLSFFRSSDSKPGSHVDNVSISQPTPQPPHFEPKQPEAEIREVLFFPDNAYGDNFSRFLFWINSAMQSLDICVFTITHDRIRDAIFRAHQRDVFVRIITDDEKIDALGSDIKAFVEVGIQVRKDSSPAHMHHKFVIVDKKVLMNGSFNWTVTAVQRNDDNVMVTNQAKLVQAFTVEYERLWKRFS
eukprot:c4527_g1_i1.p1 GENE.c4527_g1_i1~~c4527_g1_i1.p1  ORF type:complete len:189 (+),score=46.52 c4527_g1_i1:47-613(+)